VGGRGEETSGQMGGIYAGVEARQRAGLVPGPVASVSSAYVRCSRRRSTMVRRREAGKQRRGGGCGRYKGHLDGMGQGTAPPPLR